MTVEKMKSIIFDLQQEELKIKNTIQKAFTELVKLIKEENKKKKKNDILPKSKS